MNKGLEVVDAVLFWDEAVSDLSGDFIRIY